MLLPCFSSPRFSSRRGTAPCQCRPVHITQFHLSSMVNVLFSLACQCTGLYLRNTLWVSSSSVVYLYFAPLRRFSSPEFSQRRRKTAPCQCRPVQCSYQVHFFINLLQSFFKKYLVLSAYSFTQHCHPVSAQPELSQRKRTASCQCHVNVHIIQFHLCLHTLINVQC